MFEDASYDTLLTCDPEVFLSVSPAGMWEAALGPGRIPVLSSGRPPAVSRLPHDPGRALHIAFPLQHHTTQGGTIFLARSTRLHGSQSNYPSSEAGALSSLWLSLGTECHRIDLLRLPVPV